MFLAISTWTYTESISCISSSGNSIHTYIHTSFHIPQKVSLRNNIHTNLPENLRNAVFPNISTALTSFKIQDNERYRTH